MVTKKDFLYLAGEYKKMLAIWEFNKRTNYLTSTESWENLPDDARVTHRGLISTYQGLKKDLEDYRTDCQ